MVDPLTVYVAAKIAEIPSEIVTKMYDIAKEVALDKFRDHRVRVFLSTLAEHLAEEKKSSHETSEVDELFRAHLNDPMKSEILFESYRRVFMSASKDLGPRVIAMMTAQLFQEDRIANENEDLFFAAAESLSDKDLRHYSQLWRDGKNAGELIDMHMGLQKTPIMNRANALNEQVVYCENVDDAPHAFRRFQNLGIAHVNEIEMGGGTKKQVTLLVPKEFDRFVSLIDRATGPSNSPKTS